MSLHELIVRDPAIGGGEPTLRGTRVTLRTVLASLADGDSIEQILKSFPALNEQRVKAVIATAGTDGRTDIIQTLSIVFIFGVMLSFFVANALLGMQVRR